MKNLVLVMALVILSVGCGKHGNPTSPDDSRNSAPTFDLTRAAVQQVGRTSVGEGYIRFYGNLNSLETSISDWNGMQFNLFVTNMTTNRVVKYVTDYGNSVAIIDGKSYAATMLRAIDFGSSVRFELRILNRGQLPYIQVRYGRNGDSNLFRLLPGSMVIGVDYFTSGPIPSMDTALSASSESHTSDWEVETSQGPRMCVVPQGATDCEAR
jgi:hypothetical protein